MPMQNFIIAVYCLVDELLKNVVGEQKLRQRGFQPGLSDSEMITMEAIAEFLGIDTDKGAWEYFCNHWRDWFPAQRDSLWDLIDKVQGMLIADKGLIGADYRNELRQFSQIDLQTAVRGNMKETRSEKFVSWLKSKRRLVETVIDQLTERFNLEKVRARKIWYLTNRITRKILAHTICVFVNKQNGNPPLQFELLVQP